jgi:hypothetical protein
MSSIEQYLYIIAGVATAVVLPVIADKLRQYYPQTAAVGFKVPEWVKKYFYLAVFSAVVAGLILAGWKSQHPNDSLQWYSAFLLGFTSESAIEKTLRPKVERKLA